MNIKILFAGILIISACHSHEHETDEHTGHDEPKIQFTEYNHDFEVFAEADPFVVGDTGNILSHFSILPDFKAVETGEISVELEVNGSKISQTLKAPTRKGIYSFDICPATAGNGTLTFLINTPKGVSKLLVKNITVYKEIEEAHQAAASIQISKTNTIVFTKEQSWKIDFATDFPIAQPFGQIIKTSAQIQSAQGDENLVTAKTNGIVIYANTNLFEGKNVTAGQSLITISASGLADNNMAVRLAEAQNNYENAKADYDRHKELIKDKIISEKELLSAKNLYENAKLVYENLSQNFNAGGQSVLCPMNGFVKQFFVKNGEYVEAGRPLFLVSQNKTLLLKAEVQQKYASLLATIVSANIAVPEEGKTYSFEQLNGKILSFGKSVSSDNYLLPVTLQIDNVGNFVSGAFVNVYLKTLAGNQVITVPNEAVLEEQGLFFVLVQITPELFEKREVEPGTTDGLRIEIRKGISAGDRIVTRGAMMVKLAQAAGGLDAHSGHVH